MNKATYYLSSMENDDFAAPRECQFREYLRFDTGKECALVRVDPPIVAQEFGVAEDVDTLVLAARHKGTTLFPIKTFPCFVYICLPHRANLDEAGVISKQDLTIIAWGELYRTRLDAIEHRFD